MLLATDDAELRFMQLLLFAEAESNECAQPITLPLERCCPCSSLDNLASRWRFFGRYVGDDSYTSSSHETLLAMTCPSKLVAPPRPRIGLLGDEVVAMA